MPTNIDNINTYGRIRMYQALRLKAPESVHIPCENTVRNVMDVMGLIHEKRRKPNGITKADKAARKYIGSPYTSMVSSSA